MIAALNLAVEQSDGHLCVAEVDNATYIGLGSQPGMIQRAWQLPQHDVRYVAAAGLDRQAVKVAVATYLNDLLKEGRVG